MQNTVRASLARLHQTREKRSRNRYAWRLHVLRVHTIDGPSHRGALRVAKHATCGEREEHTGDGIHCSRRESYAGDANPLHEHRVQGDVDSEVDRGSNSEKAVR